MKTLTIKQRPLEILIHTISWLLIFILPLIVTNRDSSINWEQYMRQSFIPLCCFITFYINYLVLVPRYLFTKKYIWFFGCNFLLIVAMTGVLHFGNHLFYQHAFRGFIHRMPPPPRWPFISRDFVMFLFIIGLSTAIRVSLRWRETEEKLVETEREKTDAELKNLKNQLNPHFLLNTLNNIYALIVFNADKAQEAVQELSKMLRYVLYEDLSNFVSLKKELEFLNNYIALMRIRQSQETEISVNLSTEDESLTISPLLLISLIENAFKHGISPTEKSFISISVQGHRDGKITCEIMNSNFPKNNMDKSGSGIGLEQVKKRLELAYPSKYEWEKGVSANNTYVSTLTIYTK